MMETGTDKSTSSEQSASTPSEEMIYGVTLKEFRTWIVQADLKSQDDFDKTVIVLSGGAIGISFTYVKELLGGTYNGGWLLIGAWIAWSVSLTLVLLSFYASHKALRTTLDQIDDRSIMEIVERKEIPGGRLAKVTNVLNPIGGFLFVVGLVCMLAFMAWNVK